YVVPTGRVVVPTGSVHSEATNAQQQPNIQPQIITTVSNNNAKFPYLKKDEYERESKARTTLLQSIPDDHVADFHYMDDARDIWNAVKAKFGGNAESKKMRMSMLKQEFLEFRIGKVEGLHKGYDRMQKILSQLNQLKAKPEDEDINLKFLRTLPSSWSQVALTLKTKGLNHSAFVSTTSASKKMSYGDNLSYSSTATYTAPSNSKTGCHRSDKKIRSGGDGLEMAMLSVTVYKFEQKAGRKIDFDKKESARFNKKKVRCYKCQQRGHFARECKAKRGNDKQIYSSFKIKEIGKKEEDSKALITIDTLVDWTDHDGESDGVIASKEFGMIAGYDTEDAMEEGAAKIYNLITGADTKEASTAGDAGKFALMGVTFERVLQRNQLTLEDKIKVLSIELENTSNLLKHSERINADVETPKKELQTKLDNHLVQTKKENELGWDNSAFSVFTTNSEDVEGRPLFNRFAKTDSMKAMPLPLSEDYTSLSDHIDLDESHISYGTKSSTSNDSKSVSNDFVSCDDSDNSLEVNTNDFTSSDSSVKSSEPKPHDSTSYASTSSVSTSKNEAEIESNVGTPIQEPIIVQDLPSFSCNISDKNENTSRTSCNKNGYFNKNSGHFKKMLHLFLSYVLVGPIHSRNKVNHQNQFVPQAILLRTGKVNIPPARPQPVPTGKSKVLAPVPTCRQNRPFLVLTDRGYSPSVIFGW
nr:ribonuclease H-like domain-containing protein [Tanacetum cinerariifolium]